MMPVVAVFQTFRPQGAIPVYPEDWELPVCGTGRERARFRALRGSRLVGGAVHPSAARPPLWVRAGGTFLRAGGRNQVQHD